MKNMQNNVAIVIGILHLQTHMNILAFHVVTTSSNAKTNSLKYSGKKLILSRLKYAEIKIFSICVDVYKIYEGDVFDKMYEILSTLKNKKIKINNTLIDIYKDMLLNPNFEQNR